MADGHFAPAFIYLWRTNRIACMQPIYLGTSTLLLVCVVSCAAVSPVEGVPERAVRFMEQRFPQAEFVEWTSWEGQHIASFYDAASEQPTEVIFDNRGRWLEITANVENETLPTTILHYLEQNFEEYFATAYRLYYPNEERYGVTVDTRTHIYTLTFNAQGRLLKREEEGLDGD